VGPHVVIGGWSSRAVLRPGETHPWSADGDALFRHQPQDYAGVVHDNIGREFRETEGALRTILEKRAARGPNDAEKQAS